VSIAIFRSKIFIAVAIAAVLVALYALLGFKLAPKLVRSQAIEFVHTTYGRELKIGTVRVQPFKLQLEIHDLAFPDDDGKTMLGFERLFADFELSSLWKRAYYFRDVQLDSPVIRAVVRPGGALNLGDLAIEEPPGTPPAEPEPLPSVWIATLDVSKGVVDFLDRARSRPFERRFSPVAFGLKEFRTTPEGGDFRLTAQSEAAEKFDWKGRFALAPIISSSGDFTLDDVHATGVGEFLGDALPFQLTSGLIDLNGHYAFKLGETTDLDLQLPAIEMSDLALRAHGVDDDWVKIPTLVVADTNVKLPQQTVVIERVELTKLAAQAWLDADGSLNISRLFTPAAADDAAAATSTSAATSPTSAAPTSASPTPAAPTPAAPTPAAPKTVRSSQPSRPYWRRPTSRQDRSVSISRSRCRSSSRHGSTAPRPR